jgi:hypothetical protein
MGQRRSRATPPAVAQKDLREPRRSNNRVVNNSVVKNLVVKNNVKQRAMDLQPIFAIVDEA